MDDIKCILNNTPDICDEWVCINNNECGNCFTTCVGLNSCLFCNFNGSETILLQRMFPNI